MKNIGKLVNFSIKGVVPQDHELVNDLQTLAAICFHAAHSERARHLNYQGVDFEFLHLNLEKRYTELEKFYDVVGEYIRKLGYKVNEYQSQPDTRGNGQFTCPVACMNCSVNDIEVVLNGIYKVLQDIQEIPNEMIKIQLSGLESDFTAEISTLDQMNWLFNSRKGDSDIKTEEKPEVIAPIEEPGSLAHVVNEDIQYPNQISNEPQPEEVPQETGISVINPPESTEEVDPLGAKEPEPDHTNLFAGLYRKLRRYGRRIW